MTAGNGDGEAYRVPENTETDGLLSVQVSFHQGCALVYLIFGFVQVYSLFKFNICLE